jgi:hypothetical protein
VPDFHFLQISIREWLEMDIRNRMTDVVTLRTHALQDFLRLVLCENWRTYVYKRARTEIEGQFRNSYIDAYKKMRDVGIENYDIDDMDVSFICVIINYCGSIAKTQPKTRDALKKLTGDRNATGHSDANEDDEELYRRGWRDLDNLREFVNTVDLVESSIEDGARLSYRQKYISEIDHLMDLLDEERIELLQYRKNIQKDIQKVLNSDYPLKTWNEVHDMYMKKYFLQEKNLEKFAEFVIAAADAGIPYAHSLAIDCFIVKENYLEAVRRLKLLFETHDKLPIDEARMITDAMYWITSKSGYFNEDMEMMIKSIQTQGYPVALSDEGIYYWKRN